MRAGTATLNMRTIPGTLNGMRIQYSRAGSAAVMSQLSFKLGEPDDVIVRCRYNITV
jgi:hypothetical protein